MRSARGATCAPTPTNRSSRRSSTGSSRPRRRTPSSRNWQPWDFVVVTERDRCSKLATVWQGAGHIAGSAATIALIAPSARTSASGRSPTYDLGQATMSIMIAAADLGIGSGHSAVGDQDLARALLGLPADRYCAYLIALGYPADRPLAPLTRINRRPFDRSCTASAGEPRSALVKRALV